LTENERPNLGRVSGYDLPEWAVPELQATLGGDFDAVEARLKTRAPVILRANLRKTDRAKAIAALAKDGILAKAHDASDTAKTVTEGTRRVAQSTAYTSGLVELQDASSQAAIEALPLSQGMKILDYCAGGGGKLLAIGARVDGVYVAHDANPQRMRDLPVRAKRAGIKVKTATLAEIAKTAPFDLVFCDVPCSGSGSWRRDPEGKWTLSEAEFQVLLKVQQDILQEASAFVASDGVLVYATCSMCLSENRRQVETFIKANPTWALAVQNQWTPLKDCDGFFSAVLRKV
jgi:16S rRNA (cytosine967-C5)-methyltransferase